MLKSFVHAILVILGLMALVGLVGAGFLHYKLIKPLAQRTAVENPDDLAFVGGLVAFSCLIPDVVAHADDIDATFTLAAKLKDRGNRCKSSLSAFANCAATLAGDALDTDKRARAVQQAKQAERAYGSLRKMLSSARKIARDLPAYDDKTRAVKAVLVKMATHFAQMDRMDWLNFDEQEQDEWAEAALINPYEEQVEEWATEAETRYAGLEPLVGLLWGAYQVHPVLSNIILWDLNQYGFDEIMQRAPSFRFARQRGCLQGATLLDAAMQIIQKLDESEMFAAVGDEGLE